MISTLGSLSVLLALAACVIGAVTGTVAAMRRDTAMLGHTRVAAYAFAGLTVLANVLMEVALLGHDFSVSYVAEVGSRATPVWVTAVSLWSSLDGSILLWAGLLGVYVGAFAWVTRGRHPEHTPWALAVNLAVGAFFCFLVAGVANPFTPQVPVPADGPGPNPLLQNHILMVVHPPALYLGFVGMTVPFAMASAALLAGRMDPAWTARLRRWTIAPWGFLTAGIVLGGWWSYEVLGWGGWWAWDPVENASFLPWLTATAFLHSAVVMERRDQLRGWTLGLVLATFLLTILGTFMTRSGVFNSVHSFTQSPIGPTFLAFLAVALVFSVVLLAARMDRLSGPDRALAGPVSREAGFLVNNLLFTAFTFTVLLGTVYPLLNQALTGRQISVGEPYFNRMSAPIGLAVLFLMGVGPVLPWGRATFRDAARVLVLPGTAALVTTVASLAAGLRDGWAVATFAAGAFAAVATLREMATPVTARARAVGEALPRAAWEAVTRARRRYGGHLVHLGVVVVAVAHVAAGAWSREWTVSFTEGQTREVGGYALTFTGAGWREEPHRRSMVASFVVREGGRELAVLEPRLNHYARMGQPIGTPEVLTRAGEDLYLNLVNVEAKAGLASVEVLIKPLVVWLWLGGAVMLLGTAVAAWPARRAARAPVAQTSAVAVGGK